MKVLLAGGGASGRIVEVDDNATFYNADRIPPKKWRADDIDPVYITTQRYEPTGEMSTSGYPVWGVVEE